MMIDPHTRSSDLLSATEKQFQAEFLTMIGAILGQQSLSDIEDLIFQGRTLEALDAMIPSVTAFADQVSSGFVAAGDSTAASIAALIGKPASFNQSAPSSTSFMSDNRSRIISQFSQDQGRATGRAVGASVIRGGTALQQAHALQDSIGLTEAQVMAVEKFRTNLDNLSLDALRSKLRDASLDATVRRAVSTDTPLTSSQISMMVERYRAGLLAFRARVVAQSEALKTVNAGNLNMFRQAADLGLIDPTSITRTWKTVGDKDVRSSHSSMNGQVRGLLTPFTSGAGARLQFPGDPNGGAAETVNCRCVVETQFNGA